MTVRACTLEILITDRDIELAEHMLEHQLQHLAPICAEVIITLNRFPAPTAPVEPMNELLAATCERFAHVRVVEVDGSEEAQRRVSEAFFGGNHYPLFDFKGTPIHAILVQILEATQPYYLHLESDMLLGGDVQGWLDAGMSVLRQAGPIVAVNPLGGPPRADGVYSTPSAEQRDVAGNSGFVVTTMNTRVFLIDRHDFIRRLGPIPLRPPRDLRMRLSRFLRGARGSDLLERLISDRMAQLDLVRFDLGGPPTQPAWTLHPLHKTPTYISALTDVIGRVERNDIPEGQSGEFDVHPSLIDLPDIPSLAVRARRIMVAGSKNWPQRLRGDVSRHL